MPRLSPQKKPAPVSREEEPMNRKTLKALESSVQKWEDIAAGTGEDRGPTNCALCQRFFYGTLDCRTGNEKCPVYRETGRTGCRNSPYVDWCFCQPARPGLDKVADTPKGKRLARAERDFLIGLLP